MALSGSVRTNESEGRCVEVQWTATQDIANNKSTVSWKLVGAGSSGGWVLVSEIRIIVNGSVAYYRNSSNHTECWIGTEICSGTVDVPHNADGTKSFTISVEAGIYQWSINCSGTGSFTLDTIPRASTISLSSTSVEMGGNLTINLARASSSFTHTLRFNYSGTSITIASGVATQKTWTVPLTLANQIPNATSLQGLIICTTYNGSTKVGERSVLVTVTVPSNVVPTISNITVEDPTGNATTYDGYVQNKSKVKVTVTSSGAYSSSITKVQTTVNGVTSTSNPYTSGFITEAGGSKTVSVTVTDSRGRTATSSASYTVLSYESPTISILTTRRCDESGNTDDGGAYIKINYAGNISPLGNTNAKNILVRYKPQSSSTWTNVVDVNEYSRNTNVVVSADTNTQFDVSCVLTDSFGSTEKTTNVSTAFTLIDFNSSGRGIAFGKVSEWNLFECNMGATFKSVTTQGGVDLDMLSKVVGNRNKIISNVKHGNVGVSVPYNIAVDLDFAYLNQSHTYLIVASCSWGASFNEMTVDLLSFEGTTVALTRNTGLGGGGVTTSCVYTPESDGYMIYKVWQGNSTTQTASNIRFSVIQLV